MSGINPSNYTASSILKKVNDVIAAKQTASQEDNDVLELIEEVPASHENIEQSFTKEPELQSPSKEEEISSEKPINSPEQPIVKTEKENIERLKTMSEKLISENTAEAATAMLRELKKKSNKNKNIADQLKFESGSTVEELVSELIKPYLRTWLDENLPLIVKNVVEKEIKKLIPSED